MPVTTDFNIFSKNVINNSSHLTNPNRVLLRCPWSIAPVGYKACFGKGHAPNTYRGTDTRGYSHILYNGRPCYWASNSEGTRDRAFPKALVSGGIMIKDGEYYYIGTSGSMDKIDERFGIHLGYGKV